MSYLLQTPRLQHFRVHFLLQNIPPLPTHLYVPFFLIPNLRDCIHVFDRSWPWSIHLLQNQNIIPPTAKNYSLQTIILYQNLSDKRIYTKLTSVYAPKTVPL